MVVGAQAIDLHTHALELAVAEFTTDGDLAIDPALLPLEALQLCGAARQRDRTRKASL